MGSRSAASEGVCGTINMWDIWSEPGGQIARYQLNDGVLRQEMRRPFVFVVCFHRLWGTEREDRCE